MKTGRKPMFQTQRSGRVADTRDTESSYAPNWLGSLKRRPGRYTMGSARRLSTTSGRPLCASAGAANWAGCFWEGGAGSFFVSIWQCRDGFNEGRRRALRPLPLPTSTDLTLFAMHYATPLALYFSRRYTSTLLITASLVSSVASFPSL